MEKVRILRKLGTCPPFTARDEWRESSVLTVYRLVCPCTHLSYTGWVEMNCVCKSTYSLLWKTQYCRRLGGTILHLALCFDYFHHIHMWHEVQSCCYTGVTTVHFWTSSLNEMKWRRNRPRKQQLCPFLPRSTQFLSFSICFLPQSSLCGLADVVMKFSAYIYFIRIAIWNRHTFQFSFRAQSWSSAQYFAGLPWSSY